MANHATLSPSGANRWMVCTPSARLEETFPDTAGQAADEGTLAHEIGQLLVKHKTSRITEAEYKRQLKIHQANTLYQPEMLGYCEEYASFVLEHYADAQAHTKHPHLFLEQKLDLTSLIPEGYGTSDAVIIADHTMEIIDLKYGKGVPVSAEKNPQMMIYALGALAEYSFAYDISQVKMSIHQPRIDNNSTAEMSVADLVQWAEFELVPAAAKAFDGQGEFVPGKHCMFCRAKASCAANADYQLKLAEYDFKDESLLSDEEISDILSKAPEFEKWIKAVKQFALQQAVQQEKKWPGYKLVAGKSNRKYSDPDLVLEKLQERGFKIDMISERKPLGITAMTGFLTKPVFAKLVEPFCIKPPGKPALVPITDKRPELDSTAAAVADFQDEEVDD